MSGTTWVASSEVPGIAIRGDGILATVDWGPAATARAVGAAKDRVATAIDGTDGVNLVAAAVLGDVQLLAPPRRSRGGHQRTEGTITVALGPSAPEERRVVLVEEGGAYSWFVPAPGEDEVALPIEVVPGTRNLLTKTLRRVVRVVAVKTVGWALHHATRTIVGGWDERRHPPRLRAWGPANHRDPNAPAPDLAAFGAGPSLLVVHGFTGSIHGSFGDLSDDVVGTIAGAYGGRALAYDHPTLVATPLTNAELARDQLLAAGTPLTLDVLAHSRGGLVARELAHLLDSTGSRIRSITFVATPNDGTPLADTNRPMGLLDALTNLAGAVPGSDAIALALELLKDIVVRSGLDALEGLRAMDPDGGYLRALNDRAVGGDLAVRAIAADFEPMSDAGIVRTARDRLVDAYFGGVRNDLIVPTLSTIVTKGRFGVPPQQRLVLDSSRGVDHSTFWTNPRATHQLVEWLRADWTEKAPPLVPLDETEPLAEVALPPDPTTIGDLAAAVAKLPDQGKAALESLLGGPVDTEAKPPTGERHAVVVVPGIMGTHLAVGDRGTVWLDPVRLVRGHFRDLEVSGDGDGEPVTIAGLNRTYLPLITRLARDFDVYLAGFDWRLDIRASARALAILLSEQVLTRPDRPVTLVAHSMGGLVSRALPVFVPDVWKAMKAATRIVPGADPHPLLVMLGTPNRGSYSVVLTLTATETILKALAAIDLGNNTEELKRVVATFPGVYQMLPSHSAGPDDDHHGALYTDAGWGSSATLSPPLLADARRFHDQLAEVHDASRLVCVAGYGRSTPYRVELTSTGDLRLGVFSRGDGRVPIPLGILDGVRTYFSPASHGGLPSDRAVLDAIGGLVATGRTDRLEVEEPVRRGGDALAVPPMVPLEEFDPLPAVGTRDVAEMAAWRQAEGQLGAALSQTLGGGISTGARVRVEVSVLHASLEQSAHPIAVGHYSGLPHGGAEAFLDSKLGGALRNRLRIGNYPEQAGTALYVPAPTGRRPRGAIVLGLGAYGTLSPAVLSEAMASAVIDMVLDDVERHGPADAEKLGFGVSSVLVGTPGRHGITLDSAVPALTEGVLAALERLRELDQPIALKRVELQLVELYEQQAEDAAQVVCRLGELVDADLARGADLILADRLARGDGARPGSVPRGGSGTPWVRIAVGLDDPRRDDPGAPASEIRTMTLTAVAGGAQANLIRHDVDLAKIRAYVERAVRRDDAAWSSVSRTLYEMLFPTRAKLDLDRADSLHLLVDDVLAEVPWELLAAPTLGRDVAPLALRAGMLRQLRSDFLTRERSELPTGRFALVVGDPPQRYGRLPGARVEAASVADLVEGRDWLVTRRIYGAEAQEGEAWTEILDALHEHPYRLIHVAAHGVIHPDERSSGVVIGSEIHQRLTALDFEKMTVTPDMVFLNCCHLGQMGTQLATNEALPDELRHPHRVAATVARQLLRNGVRAVVVAGWAVDDVAAAAFADVLYQNMLDGHPFGEAVRRARQAAYEEDGGRSNTWGAYQCYGDPDFELVADEPVRASSWSVVSSRQLARELDVLAARAGSATSDAHRLEVATEIDRLRVAGEGLLDDGAALASLGRSLAEVGNYVQATHAYEAALRHSRGGADIATIEQLANIRARLAKQKIQDDHDPDAAKELFKDSLAVLDGLVKVAGSTAERCALRGAILKRRAATLANGAREADLAAARDAYTQAWKLSSDHHGARLDTYHTNLRLQTSALTRPEIGLDDDEAELLDRLHAEVMSAAAKPTDYWDAAALADTLVTYALVGRRIDGQPVTLSDAADRYAAAFALRSTVRQRDSVISHLMDLRDLAGPNRAAEFDKVLVSLVSSI